MHAQNFGALWNLPPDDSFAHYYLGRVQLDAKLYAEAFQELERSGVPRPADAEFLHPGSYGIPRTRPARRRAQDGPTVS